jgi:UDP-glucose 4-epimerase
MQGETNVTYLVTGGAGFIGSHVVDALLMRGDSVIALDNLATGRLSNLDSAHVYPGFQFVQGSVLDEDLVDDLVRRCGTVIHLAAAVGVKLVMAEPLESLTTNIRGSELVIAAAHRHRRRILITSTSEIYGKNCSGPLREDADRVLGSPTVVRWSYSTAKAVEEILAGIYHRRGQLSTIVVRLFNTVGPRQSAAYGMVIPRLVGQAVRGEPLTIYGTGRQRRCFMHVSDAVDAMLRLLGGEAAYGGTFNVGSSEEISILELARKIISCTASTSPIELVPYEQAYGEGFEDMLRRVPDTTSLRGVTGWAPRLRLADVLDQAIAEARRDLPRRADMAVS